MLEVASEKRVADGVGFAVRIQEAADPEQMVQGLFRLAVPGQGPRQFQGKAVKEGDGQQQAADLAVPIAEQLPVKVGEHLAVAAVDRLCGQLLPLREPQADDLCGYREAAALPVQAQHVLLGQRQARFLRQLRHVLGPQLEHLVADHSQQAGQLEGEEPIRQGGPAEQKHMGICRRLAEQRLHTLAKAGLVLQHVAVVQYHQSCTIRRHPVQRVLIPQAGIGVTPASEIPAHRRGLSPACGGGNVDEFVCRQRLIQRSGQRPGYQDDLFLSRHPCVPFPFRCMLSYHRSRNCKSHLGVISQIS